MVLSSPAYSPETVSMLQSVSHPSHNHVTCLTCMTSHPQSNNQQFLMEPQSLPIPSESGLSKIKNFITNSLFHIEGYFHKKEHTQPISLFGKTYSSEEGVVECAKIIWFTYRKNFVGLLKSEWNTDSGWGCMIRAGQMLLAQTLRRYSRIQKEEEMLPLVSAFIDNDAGNRDSINYSISKIVSHCDKIFEIQPGQWLSVSNVAFVLEELHNQMPLRGYDKLKLKTFENGAIFYDEIVKAMGYKPCSCKPNRSVCCRQNCHQERCNTAVMITVVIRLGAQNSCKKYQPMLMDLFKVKSFNGMIGGKPKKALFFVGLQGEDLVYLDPHYVQDSTTCRNLETKMETYFCKGVRTIEFQSIDPSAGVSFYFSRLEEVSEFRCEIEELRERYGKEFLLYTQYEEPVDVGVNVDSDSFCVSETSAEIIVKEDSMSVEALYSFDA